MKTLYINSNTVDIRAAREADMICFCPEPEALLPCRSAWRECLISALRRDIPIAAVLRGFDGSPAQRERDVLCELLSYVSFIFLDSRSASLFLSAEDNEPDAVLRAIHKRFGVCAVILTDEGLAFDGERITPFEED